MSTLYLAVFACIAPADALFIDDKAANAEGAREAGLLAHHFTDIPGLRNALRRRKATPAELAREAESGGIWPTMEPYQMALTSDA